MTRILIVDDKEENLYYLRSLLAGHGCDVDTARHGAEALVKARQTTPDVVISDLLMPVMDGYTLLRLWKADAKLKHIPFIVYTATYTEPEDERLALSLGADAFILKPAEPEDFLARIRQVPINSGSPPNPPNVPMGDEKELLKVYSETLIRKLEEKTLQLEETNRALQEDIAERKKAEEELRWKTAFLEAQVDSSMDGILVVDSEGKKILQNQRMNALWKIPPNIAENKDDALQVEFVIKRTKDPVRFAAKIAHLNSHPDEVSRDIIELIDGTILDRYSSPVRDKAGKYYGRIWVFRDITEQRKVEEQLRQKQKMEAIGTLAGGIAHDFNNILSAILGYAELARLRMTGNSLTVEKYLDAVLEGGARAVALVQQILAFSRQEERQRLPIEIRQAVAEPLNLLRASIPSTIEFDVSLATDLPAVLADATQVHQIVMNLCTNAAHAMRGRPGRLGVRLENFTVDALLASASPGLQPGSYVRLSISDTGHGMDAATKARIFEPFFTTKAPGEGTGLGLSVVHGIMQSYGGAITVYSQPGEGTVFHLYFPVAAEQTAVAQVVVPAKTPTGHGEHILFVDDELPLASLGQKMLEELGYTAEKTTSVGEALGLMRANPAAFDLIITDLTMPGMLGTDFTRELLHLRPDLPVILITGHSASLTDESVHELGIRELLVKPLTLQTLGAAVHRVLSNQPHSET